MWWRGRGGGGDGDTVHHYLVWLGLHRYTLIRYLGFMGTFYVFNTLLYCLVGCLSMFVWTHAVLGVLHACVLYFCIYTCSAQLSMVHVERRSRNTLFVVVVVVVVVFIIIIIIIMIIMIIMIIIIIIIIIIITWKGSQPIYAHLLFFIKRSLIFCS